MQYKKNNDGPEILGPFIEILLWVIVARRPQLAYDRSQLLSPHTRPNTNKKTPSQILLTESWKKWHCQQSREGRNEKYCRYINNGVFLWEPKRTYGYMKKKILYWIKWKAEAPQRSRKKGKLPNINPLMKVREKIYILCCCHALKCWAYLYFNKQHFCYASPFICFMILTSATHIKCNRNEN